MLHVLRLRQLIAHRCSAVFKNWLSAACWRCNVRLAARWLSASLLSTSENSCNVEWQPLTSHFSPVSQLGPLKVHIRVAAGTRGQLGLDLHGLAGYSPAAPQQQATAASAAVGARTTAHEDAPAQPWQRKSAIW